MSVTVPTRTAPDPDRLVPLVELFGDDRPERLGESDVRAIVRRRGVGLVIVVQARRGWQGEHEAWLNVAYWRPRRFRQGLAPAHPEEPQFSRAWTLPYAEAAWAGRGRS